MNERYDVDVAGRSDGGGLDVRELLEEASWTGQQDHVDADGTWRAGRRRRTLHRAGVGTLTGVAAASVLVLGWQAGVLDGRDAREPTVAAVPDGWTTFVLAAPDAPAVDPATIDAVSVPEADALRGTTWELLPVLHGSGADTGAVVPAHDQTEFSFAQQGGRGWGFEIAGCGSGWFQGDLELDGEGRFPAGDLATSDIGCSGPVQEAEDLWLAALGGGGALRTLGDGGQWLLLSVDVPDAVAAPLVTGEPAPTSDRDPEVAVPDPDASGEDGGAAAEDEPAPRPQAPLPGVLPPEKADPTESLGEGTAPPPDAAPPSAPPSAPPETAPPETAPPETAPPPDDGPAFAAPAEVTAGGSFPDGGGELLAPTVRAGRNDGFDRVVVDLTGTGAPGWRASYPGGAVRDGSGLPAGVAGDSVLEVVLSGMAYPEAGDPVYDAGDFGLDTHTLAGVVEVIRTTPFEGHLQLFVGVTGEPRPYRVFLLQDPLRLVVDVQHPG